MPRDQVALAARPKRKRASNLPDAWDISIWLSAAGQLLLDGNGKCKTVNAAFHKVRKDPTLKCTIGVRTLNRYLDRWLADGRIWQKLARARTTAIARSLRPIAELAWVRERERRGKSKHVRGRGKEWG